jgi:hypothetical protein
MPYFPPCRNRHFAANLTSNDCKAGGGFSTDGTFVPERDVQRVRWRSMSLDASAPQRMTAGAHANGA